MVDVTDSKSVGLIPRVGSSPTTGTKKEFAFFGGLFFDSIRDSNGSGSEWSAGGTPEPRPGLHRSAGRVPPPAPRRRGLHIVRDDFFLRSKSHLSLISSLLLSKSNPLCWASIWFFNKRNLLSPQMKNRPTGGFFIFNPCGSVLRRHCQPGPAFRAEQNARPQRSKRRWRA